MSSSPISPLPSQYRMIAAASCVPAGAGLLAFGLQTVLGDYELCRQFLSRRWWGQVAGFFGAPAGAVSSQVEIDPLVLFLYLLPLALVLWTAGAWWISKRRREPFRTALADWGIRGWVWWMIPGLWETANIATGYDGWERATMFLASTVPLWYALAAAGWLAGFFTLCARTPTVEITTGLSAKTSRVPWTVWLFVGLYAIVFIAMNWQLYRGLHVPHGDSAMYEEHLWNVTHGKGFRSYLDGGLFLGEHIQVIHLLLLPLHYLWPSHLLLELCESLALASGAIPVYWMARRHTASAKPAIALAAVYLLYFPLHYLDISIDLKTFRPISFGVPLLLFALDQLERRRYRSMLCFMLLTLAAKEDFAVILAMLGIWIALFPAQASGPTASRKHIRLLGAGLALFAAIYLLVVIKSVIPWFREGDVHYAQYFGELGNTPGDIVQSMFTQPGLVIGKLFSIRSITYVLLLFLPMGFLPLFSPGRLAVAVPTFCVLCLLELSADPAEQGMTLLPWHHFHAPLLPILFWSAAAGVRKTDDTLKRIPQGWFARFAVSSAVVSGVIYGFSPLSLTFWDTGSRMHWRDLYVPGKRAQSFASVERLIPKDARVASTDFIHPRFTHHERSYDYSNYPRAVNNNKPGAPPDTDYIVIDTKSRYSEISRPEQIPEYAEHPDDWELLHHPAEEYFIVLKRKRHDRSEE